MNEHVPKSSADACRAGRRGGTADLVVVGGGLTGLALAVAVASAGLRVRLIERRPLAPTTAPGFDGRVTAIASASRRLFEQIGAWAAMAGAAEPIRDIHVAEAFSTSGVHYDHRALGHEPLGHIVENRVIRQALLARAGELGELAIDAPCEIATLERDGPIARIALVGGGTVMAPLVAAADGRGSALRRAAGIGVTRWGYGQTGIVCTLAHPRPHQGLAVERFFPDGPFARLPLPGRRSSIVWALDKGLAAEVTALADEAFLEEVAERFGGDLGPLRLDGPRFSYPLALVWSRRLTDRRLALVGDAARAIHPIAGQGWNLALRDVGALAEIVVDARRLGLDLGGPQALARYERWRRFDGLALVAITDGINRLFANDLPPLRLLRGLGLGLVDRLPPLKRLFMRHAMGLLGDLPRPMRGQAL